MSEHFTVFIGRLLSFRPPLYWSMTVLTLCMTEKGEQEGQETACGCLLLHQAALIHFRSVVSTPLALGNSQAIRYCPKYHTSAGEECDTQRKQWLTGVRRTCGDGRRGIDTAARQVVAPRMMDRDAAEARGSNVSLLTSRLHVPILSHLPFRFPASLAPPAVYGIRNTKLYFIRSWLDPLSR